MSNDHIHHDHERHTPLVPAAEAHADSGTALRDPVCGMIVDPAAGKPMLDHAGHRYHFCSSACRDKFKAAPDIYVSAKDPVCGMDVARDTARHFLKHEGRGYYFCSPACEGKFTAEPARYLSGTPAAQAMPKGTQYTCPMHPEIRQVGPGSCPICGMALEPELATADSGPNPELADMTRRFWIGLVLTVPVFVLEMGAHLFPALLHAIPSGISNWVQLAFATPVVLWAGLPFFERGWRSLVTRKLNMFTLIAMGTGVAWAYSVIATLLPGLFPDSLRSHEGSVPVYFEAAAVITVLVLLGQVLELRARDQTSGAIKALLGLAPKTARRIGADGSEAEVALDLVQDWRCAARTARRKSAGRRRGHRWTLVGR
jgi:Cu+-exporting ATPase